MSAGGESFRLGVLILGAGASARMGRPKLVLPWGEGTVIAHLLDQWRRVGASHVAIVCTRTNRPLHHELSRIGFAEADRVINPAPEQGMFGSIQVGAAWSGWDRSLTHWAICLGDQPLCRVETLRSLVEFARGQCDRICQPARERKARHPVILPAPCFRELAVSAEQDLRAWLNRHSDKRSLLESNDSGLDMDLDTPDDYQRAIEVRARAVRSEQTNALMNA